MAIRFSYADRRLDLNDKRKIQKFVTFLFASEGKEPGAINYVFCSDEFLLDLNKRFLDHDYYTDIITFDLSAGPGHVDAEIYISVDRVKDNATVNDSDFTSEMLRVIFHGALHLCGFKDKTISESGVMRNKEEQYLRLYMKS